MLSLARPHHRATIVLLWSLLLACSVAAAEPEATEPWGERLEWQGAVAERGTVRVHNPYGDVRARFGGWSDQVEVLGNLQHLHPSGAHLELRIEPAAEGLLVEVRYPTGTSTAAVDRSRADLAVLIPNGIALDVKARHGAIDCKGLRGDVFATTETGDITVRKLHGAVQATSDRGEILVVLEPDSTQAAQVLETRTGNIQAHLAPTASLRVEAATSGFITTDFSATIEHRDTAEPNKLATVVVGSATNQLSIRSLQGSVSILRRPPAPASSTN